MPPDPAQADLLSKLHADTRKPPAELVGKLEKRYTDKKGVERFIELEYLGHAAVTDILLAHDPEWTWEPAAVDELDRPAVDRDKDGWPRGLWIRLTIHGHTRLGYGTCPAGKQDAIKELIGDALRNAAMRFGVGLSLWAKEEWQDFDVEAGDDSSRAGGRSHGTSGKEANQENVSQPGNVRTLPTPTDADVARHPSNGPALRRDQAIAAKAADLGLTEDERQDAIERVTNGRTRSGKELKGGEGTLVFAELEAMAKAKSRGPA